MKKEDRYYEYPIKYTNLTGFSIDKVVIDEEKLTKAISDAVGLKRNMMALRGVFA
ncbi:hypothetical protein [Raoultella planticola]|nr:hypothetical protein [Raoultella planticola]